MSERFLAVDAPFIDTRIELSMLLRWMLYVYGPPFHEVEPQSESVQRMKIGASFHGQLRVSCPSSRTSENVTPAF